MSETNQIELGLTIPLQRRLHIRALPYGKEPDRRFCWPSTATAGMPSRSTI